MSRSHATTKKTVHAVSVYPQSGNPFEEFFSTEEKAREFSRSESARTSYNGEKRVDFTSEYPIYDANVFHISAIDYRDCAV